MEGEMNHKRIFRSAVVSLLFITIVVATCSYQPAVAFTQEPVTTDAEVLSFNMSGSDVEPPLARLKAILRSVPQSADNLDALDYLKKMDSHLQTLVADHLLQMDLSVTAAQEDLHFTSDGMLLIDVYVTGSVHEATRVLEEQGMQVAATDDHFGIVEGSLPVDAVLAVAELDFTKALMPVTAFGVETGSVTSQGDASHNGPTARTVNEDGTGVVVGIISDSMDRAGARLAGSQAGGDLPAGVTILNDGDAGDSDEVRLRPSPILSPMG
jgi:hypothetical protein